MKRLPAESAHHPDRRPGHQEPVPVLHAVARQAGAVRAGATSCERLIAKLPGWRTSPATWPITSPQVNVTIDRDKAAAMQVNANQIENALYDAYGPRWVSTIYGADQRVQGAAGTEAASTRPIRARFRCCTSRTPNGKLIPLDTLAKSSPGLGPQTINHYGQLPAATISFNLKPGASLGDVVDKIQAIAGRERCRPTISTQLPGRGQGVPEFARQPVGAADRRHPGGVHRARHSVRKLHPPASRFFPACPRPASARC